MIPAAALLVLAGLGLFVAGVLTGVTAWYWACVVACGLAVVLLVVARLRAPAGTDAPLLDTATTPGPAAGPATGPGGTSGGDPSPPAPPAAGTRAGATPAAGAPAGDARPAGRHEAPGDPAEEDVEVTDLLLVVDLPDEVLVVDEHPRYHLGDCRWLAGRETIPLPVAEARADGFTPCAVCGPDAHLAAVERARRSARRD